MFVKCLILFGVIALCQSTFIKKHPKFMPTFKHQPRVIIKKVPIIQKVPVYQRQVVIKRVPQYIERIVRVPVYINGPSIGGGIGGGVIGGGIGGGVGGGAGIGGNIDIATAVNDADDVTINVNAASVGGAGVSRGFDNNNNNNNFDNRFDNNNNFDNGFSNNGFDNRFDNNGFFGGLGAGAIGGGSISGGSIGGSTIGQQQAPRVDVTLQQDIHQTQIQQGGQHGGFGKGPISPVHHIGGGHPTRF